MGRLHGKVADRLELYVQQSAWLNTAPTQSGKVSERSKPKTRLEQIKETGGRIPLPPNPARYLTDWFFEIGPTSPAGMGEGPIGWTDITAWQSLTGIELQPWEARTIRRLSIAFVHQRSVAKEPDCPAPYKDETLAVAQRNKVDQQFKALFKAMAKK